MENQRQKDDREKASIWLAACMGKGNAAAVKAMLETTEAEVSPTEKEEVSLKSEIGRNVLGNRQKQNDGEMKSQDG
jgi:hypothetical protein